MILFTLSMPNVGSWNGKWTGDSNLYVKTRRNPSKEIMDKIVDRSFYYNFGDGWGASVGVKKISSKESNKTMKKSKGFCGYDWMIDEIIKFGKILTIKEREQL